MRRALPLVLLLLAGCDTPADKAQRAEMNALEANTRTQMTATDIQRLYERIEQLEAKEQTNSSNISTLFKSRDAMNRIHDADQKWNEESISDLFKNDKVLNANSARPTYVVDDR